MLGHAPTVGQPVNADALAGGAGATAQVAVNGTNGKAADDDKPPAGPPAPGGAYGAPPPQQQQGQNFQNQNQQQQMQQQQQNNNNFSYGRGAGPVARADGPARVVPIASLNAYQNRWTIRGRVTMKSEVKHFQNARGEGKLFSFDLLDEHGGDIRCAGFGDAVDRWYDVVQPGSILSLSRASLKPKRPGPFNATSHDLEITLEPGSVLQVLPEDSCPEIPRQRYSLRKLAALADAAPRTNVDVAGVVEAVAPSTSITRRDGSEARKRSVTLRDDSGAAVELTLWGAFAGAALGDQLDELVNGPASSRPVLVGKALSVGDFGGGRTLSTSGSSVVTLDPQDVSVEVSCLFFRKSGFFLLRARERARGRKTHPSFFFLSLSLRSLRPPTSRPGTLPAARTSPSTPSPAAAAAGSAGPGAPARTAACSSATSRTRPREAASRGCRSQGRSRS